MPANSANPPKTPDGGSRARSSAASSASLPPNTWVADVDASVNPTSFEDAYKLEEELGRWGLISVDILVVVTVDLVVVLECLGVGLGSLKEFSIIIR